MTQLIVSVRDVAEAAVALESGADLIDVKEPLRGPLGASDVETIDAIATLLDGRLPLSAALGELSAAATLPAAFAGRVRYAKIGLAGCDSMPDWRQRWQSAVMALPSGVAAVAVAYADWQSAGAPPPDIVLEHGIALGCRAALLDTFDKSRGPLFCHLSTDAVARFVRTARRQQLVSVVAGSLGLAEIAQALQLAPDFVAVRGAVCDIRRTGSLDAARVAHLASLIHAPTASSRPFVA
ncbi:MAG: (5-formylfuran-3-yl)methyl phosphate synthase [Pirellulales bacterium]